MAAHRILDQSRYIDPRRERKRDSGATWRVVPGKFRAYYAELYRELVHKIPDGKAAFIFARADFVNVDRRLHQRWTLNHFVIAVWSAKEAESAA